MKSGHKLPPLALALAILLVGASVVAAQGPSGTYGSGIACTNLSTTTAANLVISFYAADSSTVVLSYADPTPVPAGASRNYFTPSTPPGLPSAFLGAAVVSSDQPIACNVNTQVVTAGAGTTTTPARIGTSAGLDSAETGAALYAPQLFKNFSSSNWNSYVAVQNTTSSPLTVYVSYVDRFGTAYPAARESFVIPAQTSHVFYQASNVNLPNNFLGGATITSTGNLAATANFYNGAANYQNAQLHSYNPVMAGASTLFVPRFVRNYYGFNSGLSVQNVGAASTSVTVTFTFAGNSYVVNSGTIVPGGTYSPYAPNISQLAPVDSLGVGVRFGSAVIQAAPGGLVTAIVNEDNRGTCGSASCPGIPANQVGWGSTYNAVPNGDQSPTVFFSQVTRNVSSAQFSSGFQITDASGTGGTCNIQYSGASAANETSVPLAANGSISRFAPNVANLPDGFNSSVKVTCTVAVVGIANLSGRNAAYYGDSMTTANGLNQ